MLVVVHRFLLQVEKLRAAQGEPMGTLRLDDPRAFSLKEYYLQKKRNARNSPQYEKWRRHILDRDKICQKCGSSENLHVHHIGQYVDNEWLRLKNMNGVVLCKTCHSLQHPWMHKEKKVVIVRRADTEKRIVK
jgi:5-methylcytosine-specific restriction endonuclease McrA